MICGALKKFSGSLSWLSTVLNVALGNIDIFGREKGAMDFALYLVGALDCRLSLGAIRDFVLFFILTGDLIIPDSSLGFLI